MVIKSVNDLVERSFKTFTREEQLEIVKRGRFTDLSNLYQNDKGKFRIFSVTWYQRIKWLTGNTVNERLYCWSCVLFPSGSSKLWNSTGFEDLKNLSAAIKKHEELKEHTYSTIKLKLFTKQERSEEVKEEIVESNVRVKRNREYMKRLIDIASALACYEIPFSKDGDEGFYKHLINLFRKYDDVVSSQIEENCFKGLTKMIQTDLLHAIQHTVQQAIASEVSEASFFALIVDVVHCSTKSRQMAVSVRYVKTAKPVERLIGFYDIGINNKAEEIVATLTRELEIFNFKEKMISQSYDGNVVTSIDFYHLQQSMKNLKESSAKCQLVHCYAHDFCTVLESVLRKIQECKLFFSVIHMFTSFFNKHLKDVVQSDVVSSMQTMYSCIVNLKDNYSQVLLALEYINTTEEFDFSSEVISTAVNLINHLRSYKFMVFVNIFYSIFTVINACMEQLKKKYYNSDVSRKVINYLQDKLKKMKSQISYNRLFTEIPIASGQPAILTSLYALYEQIINNVVYEIEGRFLDIELAEFASLVDLEQIAKSTKAQPDTSLISSLMDTYSQFFNITKLQSEIYLLYSDPSIAGVKDGEMKCASDMLNFIYRNDISSCLPMLTKLLELIITIPSIAEPLEGNQSIFNRIKNYCDERLNRESKDLLAFFVIEKDFFTELQTTNKWHDKVIDYFATLPSTSSIELLYKNNERTSPEQIEVLAEPELFIKTETEIN